VKRVVRRGSQGRLISQKRSITVFNLSFSPGFVKNVTVLRGYERHRTCRSWPTVKRVFGRLPGWYILRYTHREATLVVYPVTHTGKLPWWYIHGYTHREASLGGIPGYIHREASLGGIPGYTHREASLVGIPPCTHREASLVGIPPYIHLWYTRVDTPYIHLWYTRVGVHSP